MTRVARTRTKPDGPCTGTIKHLVNGSVVQTETITFQGTNSVDDLHGRPIAPSPFTSNQSNGFLITKGKVASSWAFNPATSEYLDFNDCPIWAGDGGNAVGLLSTPSGWFLDTVAGTNPSRPTLTIPELVQDFIEIPRQIRDIGRLYKKDLRGKLTDKDAASTFLGIKFGWIPLVEDLRQLLDLQSIVLKRVKELQQLHSGRGLRRRLKFADDHKSFELFWDRPLIGTNNKIRVPIDRTVKRRTWATITWKPTAPPPYNPYDVRMNDYMRNIVLGITPEGLTKGLWNVIPWTWFLGWFTNIGKYLLANSNTVPASHSEACFMNEKIETYKVKSPQLIGCSNDSFFYAHGQTVKSLKTRIVSGALTPGFNMPFLDMSKLLVLEALAIQRIPRWKRYGH